MRRDDRSVLAALRALLTQPDKDGLIRAHRYLEGMDRSDGREVIDNPRLKKQAAVVPLRKVG